MSTATAAREFTDNFVQVGKLKLHYLDWGTKGKPPMLLLHGGSQTAHSWDEFSREMRRDYHVIALDERGHGDSDWSKSGIYTAKAQAQDVQRFVDKVGLRRFILIGLSMGGRNSIMYAGLHPERVERLVIVDVGPEIMKKGGRNIRRFTSSTDILPTFEDFIQRAHQFNPRRPIEQLRERLSWNLRQLPDGRWTWKYDRRFRGRRGRSMLHENLWPYVRRIKAPTLIIRGAESDVLSEAQAKRLQKAIPGCAYTVVQKAGHTVPGDNPPAFRKAVVEWLG